MDWEKAKSNVKRFAKLVKEKWRDLSDDDMAHVLERFKDYGQQR